MEKWETYFVCLIMFKYFASADTAAIATKRMRRTKTKNLPFIFKGSSDSEEDKKSLDNVIEISKVKTGRLAPGFEDFPLEVISINTIKRI